MFLQFLEDLVSAKHLGQSLKKQGSRDQPIVL